VGWSPCPLSRGISRAGVCTRRGLGQGAGAGPEHSLLKRRLLVLEAMSPAVGKKIKKHTIFKSIEKSFSTRLRSGNQVVRKENCKKIRCSPHPLYNCKIRQKIKKAGQKRLKEGWVRWSIVILILLHVQLARKMGLVRNAREQTIQIFQQTEKGAGRLPAKEQTPRSERKRGESGGASCFRGETRKRPGEDN